MNKFIEVYDNIIPSFLADKLEDLALNDIAYKYYTNITGGSNKYSPGFSHIFLGENDKNVRLLTSNFCFTFFQIIYNLCTKLNISLIDIIRGRVFLQIPSINPEITEPHTDLDFSHFVCLYYVNDSDGDTIFYKNDEKTIIKKITPKKGRLVFFDGSIPHSSTPPSKSHRIVVNFNFKGKKL